MTSTGDRYLELAENRGTSLQNVSVTTIPNNRKWVYSYHVVYEGKKLALDTKVRCWDKETQEVIGEGKVIKNAECYSEELKGRCDIWLG